MEDFLNSDAAIAIYAAIGSGIALLVRWGWRKLGDFVAGTPNKIDDKLYEAVKKALAEEKSGE